MKILHKTLADYKSMPWKNGGGTTLEMAISPEGATLGDGDFLWRVSSADVSTGGPFSLFPEHDRLLFLLSGGGVILSGEGRDVRLDHPLAGHSFRGDVPYGCTLPNGPVTDFNVIWRRDAFECTFQELHPDRHELLPLEGDISLFFTPSGISEACYDLLHTIDLVIVGDYSFGEEVPIGGVGNPLLVFTLEKI